MQAFLAAEKLFYYIKCVAFLFPYFFSSFLYIIRILVVRFRSFPSGLSLAPRIVSIDIFFASSYLCITLWITRKYTIKISLCTNCKMCVVLRFVVVVVTGLISPCLLYTSDAADE